MMYGRRMSSPCNGCSKREVGCHAVCLGYAIYVEKNNAERERRQKASRNAAHNYTVEASIKNSGKKKKER